MHDFHKELSKPNVDTIRAKSHCPSAIKFPAKIFSHSPLLLIFNTQQVQFYGNVNSIRL